MQFRQIRYFLAVAKHLNFTSAADECAVSQPALSKAIQKLEDDLGRALLDRNSREVQLTEFGRMMLIHFEKIDDNVQKARTAAAGAAKDQFTRLDVGVMCTIGPQRFASFLARFRTNNPNIEFNLHDVVPAVIPELLVAGGLDAVFCARAAKHDQRFVKVDLFSEGMCVAFAEGHRFAGLDSVSVADIAKENYLDRLNCEFRNEFLDFTRSSGLDLNVAVRSEREDWILELVAQGLGICTIPFSSTGAPRIANRPITNMPKIRNLEFVMREEARQSTANRILFEAVQSFSWQ